MKEKFANNLLEFCYLFSNNIKSVMLEYCNKNGRCNKNELTMPQIHILITIDNITNCTITDIVKEMNISKATASILTTKLELLKLIKKVSDKTDKRITHIVLTPKGKSVLEEKNNIFKEVIIKSIDSMDKEDFEYVKDALIKVNSIFKKYEERKERKVENE